MGREIAAGHGAQPREVIATMESSSERTTVPNPGYWLVTGRNMIEMIKTEGDFAAFAAQWNDLPADPYLASGKPFRFRRHAQVVFDADTGELTTLPPAAYLQATANNSLFGGVPRRFAPVEWTSATRRMITSMVHASVVRVLRLPGRSLINVHQVRIVGGPRRAGTPVPEGRHRDGFDFISIHLIGRDVDGGGETTLMSGDGSTVTVTLAEPMDAVYIDDRRFSHDTTPIVGIDRQVRRDVLLMSFEQSGARASDAPAT